MEQKETQATCIFHYNDGAVIVEIVALNTRRHKNLWRYLESLSAREVSWALPSDCIADFNDGNWNDLRYRFAVCVDRNSIKVVPQKKNSSASKGSQIVSMHVWGFGSLIDSALTYMLTSGTSNEKREDEILWVTDGAMENSKLRSEQDGSVDDDQMSRGFKVKSSYNSSTICRGNYTGSFVFQDREAGIFYQNFEPEFRRYISAVFQVDITETAPSEMSSSSTRSRDGGSPPSSVSGAPAIARSPALRVDFSGSTPKDVSNCRSYLEQLNTSNLQRHQIYFPRTHTTKYKELLNHKVFFFFLVFHLYT
jgi:hypothetical protein